MILRLSFLVLPLAFIAQQGAVAGQSQPLFVVIAATGFRGEDSYFGDVRTPEK